VIKSLARLARSAIAKRVAAAASPKSIKRVLVVDDDVVMLRLVRESLTSLMSCEVETTPNPEYAFEMVLQQAFDLLIFDFSMPGIDGAVLYSLISKLYALQPPHGTAKLPPLILMSGNADQKRAQELLREPGVRGLLAKPFSIERLLEKVSELISQ
jgi:CheY-like chemotaxis protein